MGATKDVISDNGAIKQQSNRGKENLPNQNPIVNTRHAMMRQQKGKERGQTADGTSPANRMKNDSIELLN